MWTEPSPAEELAEKIQKEIDSFRPVPNDFDLEFNKKGWDKSVEIHEKKEALFLKLQDGSLKPSEYIKIMDEINHL